jgi:hypothetical protein
MNFQRRKTQKRGGDISESNAYKYIISIGYEIETGHFTKLTSTLQYNYETEEDEHIFLNTDTARYDLEKFKKVSTNDDDEEYDEDFILRQEELIDIPSYTNNKIDKNVSFQITNDKSDSGIILAERCYENDEGTYYFTEKKSGNETKIVILPLKDCSPLSFVEWVATYYKPNPSKNIILETYINTIDNLVRHLNELEKIEGSMIFKGDNVDIQIKPENRILYHKPNTNLYYLQTHNTKVINRLLDIDDISSISQMTFACNVENVFYIMKTITKDNFKTIKSFDKIFNKRFEDLNKLEKCIEILFQSYNEKEEEYKFTFTKKNKKLFNQISNYLALILYKIYMYLTVYLKNKKKVNYFKDVLFFNCRHSNNKLYIELKKCLKLFFSEKLAYIDDTEKNKIVANIVKKIVVQKDILLKHFLEQPSDIRRGALDTSNVVEKSSTGYGNPYFSFDSYFDFFEDPVISDDENYDINDWFQYKDVDVHSNQMEINDNIVLVEYRAFSKSLAIYLRDVANKNLNKDILQSPYEDKDFKNNKGSLSIKQMKYLSEQFKKENKSLGGYSKMSKRRTVKLN